MGEGFTVIVKVFASPVQLLAVGIAIIVTVPGEFVVFLSFQEGIVAAVPEGEAPVIPFVELVDHI